MKKVRVAMPIPWLVCITIIGCASAGAPQSVSSSGKVVTESVAPLDAADAGPGFVWPAGGWPTEEIPFPLNFAASLPYSGVEELRFSPGFFTPQASDYWSYAFVWLLDGSPDLSKHALEKALLTYYQGLCASSAPDGGSFDPAGFAVHLSQLASSPARGRGEGEGRAFEGTVDSYDPFVTQAPLHLRIRITISNCAEGRTAAMFLVSPALPRESVWNALEDKRHAFSCL